MSKLSKQERFEINHDAIEGAQKDLENGEDITNVEIKDDENDSEIELSTPNKDPKKE